MSGKDWNQEDAFWAMNEWERMDVLKCVTVTLVSVQNLPSRVKRLAAGPLATHQISVQSVQPFPTYRKRVRTCTRAAVPFGYSCTCART